MHLSFDLVWDYVGTASGNSLIDPYSPEFWAQETLALLEENLVAAQLCHRDFENTVARMGDTVHTRKPQARTATRKGVDDSIVRTAAVSDDIPVVLNQHIYDSFIVKDEEMSKSHKDLVSEFMQPSALSLSQMIDRIVLGQCHQFYNNFGGALAGLTTSNGLQYVLETREAMNNNNVPASGRHYIYGPGAETKLLQQQEFIHADKRGDSGTALHDASIGHIIGSDHWMDQMATDITAQTVKFTGTTTNAEVLGATVIEVTSGDAAAVAGGFCTIVGDDTPLRIASVTNGGGGGEVTVLTLAAPGLRKAVASGAAVVGVDTGAVNEGDDYAVGEYGAITYDGFTTIPVVGQGVTFGTATDIYSVVAATATTILLDRPLDAAISDDDVIGVVPVGSYNLAMDRGAIALVIRPLVEIPNKFGVDMSRATHNGLTIRVTMQYDSDEQGMKVTLDLLAGVKVLDATRGAVMFG